MLSRSELTLQMSKCGSQSVPPNLVLHASLGQIRIHKALSFAGPAVSLFSAKSNLSWAKCESFKPTDLHLVASISFRIRLCLPSNTGLFCSFCHGVFIVSVLVLHLDSMMMCGSSFKSDSTYKYCPIQSTPTLNPQFESLNPGVLRVFYCVFGI